MGMDTAARIDPAGVPGMFARAGIRPKISVWIYDVWPSYSEEPWVCGCILSAVAAQRIGLANTRSAVAPLAELSVCEGAMRLAVDLRLDPSYAAGLAMGWDGYEAHEVDPAKEGVADFDAFGLGLEDGRAAARACGLD